MVLVLLQLVILVLLASMMHYRASTIIPTAEPDGGVLAHFYTGGSNSYGRADEVGYAEDSMKLDTCHQFIQGFLLEYNMGLLKKYNSKRFSV